MASGYIDLINATKSANLLANWPLNETSGTTADNAEGTAQRDGTFSGVSLDNDVSVVGEPVGLWDGSNDYCDIYSTSLRNSFDGDEGSLSFWFKVSGSSVWTDSTTRYLIRLRSDDDNIFEIYKGAVDNRIVLRREGNNTNQQVIDDTAKGAGWVHYAITWSISSDEFKAYINGAQIGTTQTGNQSWSSNLLDSATTLIGALNQTPNGVADGYISDVAIWDTILTDSEIAQLYVESTTSDTDASGSTESGGVTTTTTTYTTTYIHTTYDTEA